MPTSAIEALKDFGELEEVERFFKDPTVMKVARFLYDLQKRLPDVPRKPEDVITYRRISQSCGVDFGTLEKIFYQKRIGTMLFGIYQCIINGRVYEGVELTAIAKDYLKESGLIKE